VVSIITHMDRHFSRAFTIRCGILFLFGLGYLTLPAAQADVVAKGDTGFNLVISADTTASPQSAYRGFLNIGDWWIDSHTWFGDASGLYIEPFSGGCFCERAGEKNTLHMLVTQVIPGSEIHMTGGLGPLQMMGIHGGMSWSFKQSEPGKTTITQTYNVTGFSVDGLADLAAIVDKVQTQQTHALVQYLNGLPGNNPTLGSQ